MPSVFLLSFILPRISYGVIWCSECSLLPSCFVSFAEDDFTALDTPHHHSCFDAPGLCTSKHQSDHGWQTAVGILFKKHTLRRPAAEPHPKRMQQQPAPDNFCPAQEIQQAFWPRRQAENFSQPRTNISDLI